jgi:hypothetical protein
MKNRAKILMCIAVGLLSANCLGKDVEVPGFRDLFDGKDLAGWVNVNTADDTWNKYTIVCVDGVIKLAVNGKFVNGISKASVKKGYICLESEGAEIHFRNIKILELPPGITTPENTAPVIKNK